MALAVLDGGTYYHHDTIHGERYHHLFDRIIYVRELTPKSLADVTMLIVADRINSNLLRQHAAILIDFLQAGNTLIVLGENEAEFWVPGSAGHRGRRISGGGWRRVRNRSNSSYPRSTNCSVTCHSTIRSGIFTAS